MERQAIPGDQNAAAPSGAAVPVELEALAGKIRGRSWELAKRMVVAHVGSVGRAERFDNDVADAVFLRLQRNAQVGRYASEADVMALGRGARRLEGQGDMVVYRAAPRGASVRPGDFVADSAHEAGFYRHGGNTVHRATVPRASVLRIDGSSGGGQEFVYLPQGHVPAVAAVHFASFREFFGLVNGSTADVLPPILYRWLNAAQTRRILEDGPIDATWSHLMPDTRRVERGSCWSAEPSYWNQNSSYVACIAMRTQALPGGLRPICIDGNAAFNATNALRLAGARAKSSPSAQERQQGVARSRSIVDEFCKGHDGAPARRNEWFLRGRIEKPVEHLSAMVILACARTPLLSLARDLHGSGVLAFPVATLASLDAYGSDAQTMETAFRELEDSAPVRGGPG